MRPGTAGAGEIDNGQAVLRATGVLQQPANGGKFAQQERQLRLVGEAQGKAAFEALKQGADALDALSDGGRRWRAKRQIACDPVV